MAVTLGCGGAANGCTADLSGKHTSVIAVRSTTGETVWTRTDLPVMGAGVTRLAANGRIELVEQRHGQQTYLDAQTGKTVEHRPNGTVDVTVAPPATLGSETFAVVGDQLVAADQLTGARQWAIDLDPTKPGRSAPMVVGDTVVLAMSDDTPICP